MDEMVGGRQYIIELINFIKPKKVVINYGNHELRLGSYMSKHIDNELTELVPDTPLEYIFVDGFTHYNKQLFTKTRYEPLISEFKDNEIIYNNTWFSVIGKTIFVHPKTFSSAPLKTAQNANIWFKNEGYSFDAIVLGHTHRIGNYKIGNTMIYEQGAFCETNKMNYVDGLLINSQQEGCIYICQDKYGNFLKDKSELIYFN